MCSQIWAESKGNGIALLHRVGQESRLTTDEWISSRTVLCVRVEDIHIRIWLAPFDSFTLVHRLLLALRPSSFH